MDVRIEQTKAELGQAAAKLAAESIQQAVSARGEANLILATGASQFEILEALAKSQIPWQEVTCFHLDEYIGIPDSHPASFRRYLQERFVDQIDGPKEFHWVRGDHGDPQAECDRLGALIEQHPIDVACIGIGENGHVAFNDPPADFDTTSPYLVVELDDACRQQQFGEGWFPSFDEVPKLAISMSVQQILKSATIVCTVPDERKAQAVKGAVEGAVTPNVPASILQQHSNTYLMLDAAAASLLST